MVITEGDPANPATLLAKQQRETAITSSYDEEKAAMRMALEWLSPSHAAAAICTDSQSLLKAIQNGSADTADLRSMLNKRAGKTTLLWIPGHHGIPGNEEACACAKEAVCMYVFTDREGTKCPKRPYWGEDRIKRKIYE